MELPSTIEKLVESLRVEANSDHVTVYDLEEHLYRLVSSIDQLEFDIPPQITQNRHPTKRSFVSDAALKKMVTAQSACYQNSDDPSFRSKYNEFILLFQNQIKNKAQYYFKNSVGFTVSSIHGEQLNNSSLIPKAQLFKLRIIYSRDAKFSIDIEPYTRDLKKTWQVKILSPEEFHIQTTNPIWRYKFLPRPDTQLLSHPATYDEVIWTNENGHICEGSFTNIFFYNTQGQLCTPSLDCNILAGIMRSKIMETFEVLEGHYYPEDLTHGFFLVNSMFVKEISPSSSQL